MQQQPSKEPVNFFLDPYHSEVHQPEPHFNEMSENLFAMNQEMSRQEFKQERRADRGDRRDERVEDRQDFRQERQKDVQQTTTELTD